jgi:hypothetical protein
MCEEPLSTIIGSFVRWPTANAVNIESMARILFAFALASLACLAQHLDRSQLKAVLAFESGQPGVMPAGWRGGPPQTIFIDDKFTAVDGLLVSSATPKVPRPSPRSRT